MFMTLFTAIFFFLVGLITGWESSELEPAWAKKYFDWVDKAFNPMFNFISKKWTDWNNK